MPTTAWFTRGARSSITSVSRYGSARLTRARFILNSIADPRLYSPTVTRPQPEPGFTVWLTGLSGAEKTRVSRLGGAEPGRRGAHVEVLDGDVGRPPLSKDLGFSKE